MADINSFPIDSNSRDLFESAPPLNAAEMRELRKHVINLNLGKFSRSGKFTTSEQDVAAIFENHLQEWIQTQPDDQPVRLLLYAHGGLTEESWGLHTATFQMQWWKSQGVYPIFFCLGTGLFETLSQLFSSSQRKLQFNATRGVVSDLMAEINDRGWEMATRQLGGPRIWAGMKTSAQMSFEASGDGRVVLNHIKELATTLDRTLEIHAVGHSAGSIFLSYAMQAAGEMKLPICESIQFLAPAITCKLFEETLKTAGW